MKNPVPRPVRKRPNLTVLPDRLKVISTAAVIPAFVVLNVTVVKNRGIFWQNVRITVSVIIPAVISYIN